MEIEASTNRQVCSPERPMPAGAHGRWAHTNEQYSELGDCRLDLYNALLTMVRQNAQGFPIGHDAIVQARAVLARATSRTGRKIDWAKEKLL